MTFGGFDFSSAELDTSKDGETLLVDARGRHVEVWRVLARIEYRAIVSLSGITLHLLRDLRNYMWWDRLDDETVNMMAEELDVDPVQLGQYLTMMVDSLVWITDEVTEGFLTGWARMRLNDLLPPSIRRPLAGVRRPSERTIACGSCSLLMVLGSLGRPKVYCSATCRKAGQRGQRRHVH